MSRELPDQEIRFVRAQDIALRFTLDRPRSVSGWAVSFTVKQKVGLNTVISKTVGSGVALTDTTRGVITVTLSASDTSALEISDNLSEGESYHYDLKRTDSGYKTVLAKGAFVLDRQATA